MQPIVRISDGKLQGKVSTDWKGGKFYSFLGIPYAKPPVGDLRFKAPLPVEAWDGIKDATTEGHESFQKDFFKRMFVGSEDCLHLNLFTKSLPQDEDKLLPVMVFIHGGAFVMGSNKMDFQGPDYLMTEDIVLVVINYRLGMLGFLNLDDTSLEVPGNAGLKDQVLALQWVQKNVKAFNGDPNNVTLFGVSAGSAAVHFQVLSPAARGLFHKAILQSGSALNPWPYGTVTVGRIMEVMGRAVNSEKEALDILTNLTVEQLYNVQLQLQQERLMPLGVFGPVIEKPNGSAFLTERPIDIIRSGNYNQVPLLFGYTSDEGMFIEIFKISGMGHSAEEYTSIYTNWESFIPPEMNVKKDSNTYKAIVKKMEDVYIKSGKYNKFAAATDFYFEVGIIAAVKNHALTSSRPVYLYRMSLDTEMNFLKKMAHIENESGCSHGDDIGYIFKSSLTPALNTLQETAIKRFIKMWTNFAKFGDPTPVEKELGIIWKPVEKSSTYLLDIGEELVIDENPEPERMQMWKEIYQMDHYTEKYMP